MSVKKLLILSAASLAAVGATAALAGGPDHMAMPAAPVFQPSVYVEGHVGYAQSNWKDFTANHLIGTANDFYNANGDNKEGGFTGGLDLGYNLTEHFAAELGWFYLPEVKGARTATGSGSSFPAGTAKVSSWFAYAAAKMSASVMHNLDVFGKVGVAYRDLSYSLPGAVPADFLGINSDGHYWSPVFGAGLQYNWQCWIFGAQYMYLPGNSKQNYGQAGGTGAPNAAPEVNLYTAFVGYKFAV